MAMLPDQKLKYCRTITDNFPWLHNILSLDEEFIGILLFHVLQSNVNTHLLFPRQLLNADSLTQQNTSQWDIVLKP